MTNDPPPPRAVNDARIGAGGVLEYWDGTGWVPFEDPPEPLKGGDPEPGWLEKGAAEQGDGDGG